MTGEDRALGKVSAGRVLLTGAALLTLAAASYGLSFLKLGALSLGAALLIAAIKALIVLFVFMEFGELSASAKLAAFAALLMLALLVGLMAADIGTREPSPISVPGEAPASSTGPGAKPG